MNANSVTAIATSEEYRPKDSRDDHDPGAKLIGAIEIAQICV
jgi:hypothetical protein